MNTNSNQVLYGENSFEKRKTTKQIPTKRIDIVSLRLVRESSITYPTRKIRFAEDAAELFRPLLENSDREKFICMNLGTKHEPTSIIICSVGTLDATIVHPRDVLKSACISNASGIIVAHNHPSGDPTPSNEDIAVTKRLNDACNILGIDFLDHLVIGSNGRFESIRQRGWV
ncbi:JAB domain-containing protein [Alicyclobacillus dauci]|uniref:JAB domain-containing protein n=1 Tax=Alicyclobacillus dauci TaxID=1475485 RepID=A0ABY6Z8D7_9BACL|nr:JAB domain-containing protein [Alicyclobacillus dauci]WAH38842.1 JAB domain-containing protein [Alicyclobacillus dauci]